MRKLLTIIGAILLFMALSVTASAAELEGFYFEPTGEILEVVTTDYINLRDEEYGNEVLVPPGEKMWLFGDSKTWEDQAFVIWVRNSRRGTVLGKYLKPTGKRFEYEGEPGYGTTTSGLRQRGLNYEPMALLSKGTNVYIFGRSTQWSDRSVIFCQCSVSTVLKAYLKKTSTGPPSNKEDTKPEETQPGETKPEVSTHTERFIVSTAEFNIRAVSETPGKLGKLLHEKPIPPGEVFRVEGECPNDPDRWMVTWYGISCTIMKSTCQKELEYIPYTPVKNPYPATNWGGDKDLLSVDGRKIDEIPQHSVFVIYGTYKYDSKYWVVSWQGKLGRLDKDKTWIIDDELFVDVETQRVSLFRKSKILVLSDCVTGTKGVSPSPTGLHYVQFMESDTTLSGVNLEGEPYSKPVDYKISYYGDACFHDADGWRSQYGGTIYKTNGSLMCINCPGWAMRIIYENTYCGMRVCVTAEPDYAQNAA